MSKSLVGLDNLGNTCYMNSCIQMILHCEPFLERLFKWKEDYSGHDVRHTNVANSLYALCLMVIQNVNSSVSISPKEFKEVFGKVHQDFNGYSQHDTQEFCRLLLEDISQELNLVNQIPRYREIDTINKSKRQLNIDYDYLIRSREDSIVIDTFYGQLETIYKCQCSFETYSFEKFLDLPLLLDEISSSEILLSSLVENFFQTETIEWETDCESCKEKCKHEKTLKISILPEILIISLQRYNPRTNLKNAKPVIFEEVLDLHQYTDKECIEGQSMMYELFGVTNHIGSIDFGHYFK